MVRHFRYGIRVLLAALLAGCSKGDRSEPSVPIHIVGASELIAPATATRFEIEVECNGRWEIEMPAEARWLIALPLKRNGDGKVSLDVATNPANERTARIRFFTATDEAFLTIRQQDANDEPPPYEPPPGATSPIVTTLQASSITSSRAVVGTRYVYPFSSPPIAQVGVMWKLASQADYPEANRLTSPTPAVDTFSGTLDELLPATAYHYRGYVTTADMHTYHGEQLLLTTPAGYVGPPSVGQFYDDFSGGNTDRWLFFSTGEGWRLAADAQLGDHLICYPINSLPAQVVGYAMLPPMDVKAAPAKRLAWKIAWDYVNADATKLEIVASTDFAGDFQRASWSLLRNISLHSGTHARGQWIAGEAELGALAHSSRVFFAFRYTGKTIAYRLGEVSFGIASGGEVDPPKEPAIVWNAPEITIASGNFEQNTPGSAMLRIAYNSPSAREITGVSITPSGIAAAGFATLAGQRVALSKGAGQVSFPITGTPTTPGQVDFTIAGLPDLAAPNNRVSAFVAAAPEPPPPPQDTIVEPPEEPNEPSPTSVSWDLSGITLANWAAQMPTCRIAPASVGSLHAVSNLTQHGSGWSDDVEPAAGSWGGAGFTGNSAGNPAGASKYVSFSLRSDVRRVSLGGLSIGVSSTAGGPNQTVVLVKAGNGEWQQVGDDLSGVAALQDMPVGTLVSFRIVPCGAAAPNGSWFLNGLSVAGSER